MNKGGYVQVLEILRDFIKEIPPVSQMAEKNKDPFPILIATILSARTKDGVTQKATERLFSRASSPAEMLALSEREIAQLIYPVGFYRTKALVIHQVCKDLLCRFGGRVPDRLEDLLSLPGVGRKTANLVLSLAFGKDAICVDTHVHRISNRLGYVKTKNPQETENALKRLLPRKYWKQINTLLVKFGQDVCRPISPLCCACPVQDLCAQVGVKRSR